MMARDVKTANSRRTLPLMENVRAALLSNAIKRGITVPLFNPYFTPSTHGTVETHRVAIAAIEE